MMSMLVGGLCYGLGFGTGIAIAFILCTVLVNKFAPEVGPSKHQIEALRIYQEGNNISRTKLAVLEKLARYLRDYIDAKSE